MKKYLFALDLDGTLLYDHQTITESTKAYLRKLVADGHQIVIATGRPFRSSERFHQELGLTTPIINYNGGLVTSKHDDTFKPYSITINRKHILDIFNNNLDHIENCFGEVEDDIYLYQHTEEVDPLLHNFNGARLFVGDLNEILKDDTNGFLIIAKKGKAKHIEDYVAKHLKGQVLSRNWGAFYNYVIELYTPVTNKGRGLKYVAEHLNIKPENIVAFGDAHNDIEMLNYAGHGVAMKNAQDNLKEHADAITDYTNLEDGLIKYIQKFLENN